MLHASRQMTPTHDSKAKHYPTLKTFTRTVQAVIRLTGQSLALLIILRENWLASGQISWEEEADDHLGHPKEMKAPSPILIQQKPLP